MLLLERGIGIDTGSDCVDGSRKTAIPMKELSIYCNERFFQLDSSVLVFQASVVLCSFLLYQELCCFNKSS